MEYVGEVVETVNRYGASDWCVITAFEWESLMRVRELSPGQRTGWLTRLSDMSAEDAIGRTADAAVTQICPHVSTTDRALVEQAHESGLKVRCWGLGEDKGPQMRRLVALGVDGMTTNHPDVLMDIARERKPPAA